MTLGGLAVRNLARNKLRTGLTALGVAVAVAGFLLLRTFLWAWVAAPGRPRSTGWSPATRSR